MENASDALIMAFGVLIFVLALSVAVNAFSQAREVSEAVIYKADSTYYYDYYDEITDKGASQNRIVGLETIIPTLYKYYKENYIVLFRVGKNYDEQTGKFGSYNDTTGEYDETIDIMKLYSSPVSLNNGNSRVWRLSKDKYWDKIQTKYSSFFSSNYFATNNPTEAKTHTIFSFDLEEEQLRNEPWTISNDEIKKNLDCFIYGKTYELPSDNSEYISYDSFISKYSGRRFVENIAEISYKAVELGEDTKDKVEVNTTRTNKGKKRIYIFTLID